MTDVQPAAALPNAAPPVIRRLDYKPPDWLVPEIALDFQLDPARTIVRAILEVRRNGEHRRPLRLDGDGLTPTEVWVDGQPSAWKMDDGQLVIRLSGNEHRIETIVAIAPETNTALMGLYASGGLLCTQCEAQGFRRITFFPDRPDVLSRYSVRMEADASRYPVLLSNGNCVESGKAENNRHWAHWQDPFPKPCYLFALVAGDLAANRDRFTTMSGRDVELAIWVRQPDLPKTGHAMEALKAAMAWDERVYGREYDLNQFNIVAVDDFNFGAMENKSLNVFNSRYVLADPETATDADFDNIAGVVAHEYFHNWSGDRITCRDWFQLSLKEGFTVFRDQGFSADQGSPAVKRIEDVRVLRAAQFPEDAGPLAHPVRPESYIEISNFYTATIYNKGAEVIRMMHTLLGAEKFRAGCDRYFAEHDGQAVTCEDFVRAMEQASGQDLTQFRLWYEQAGTPRVQVRMAHDLRHGRVKIDFNQAVPPTPGQPDKRPMTIPLRLAMFDRDGGRIGDEHLFVLDEAQGSLVVEGIAARPVLSLNRGFSAPVIINADRDPAALALLSAHDDDPFARYEAMQQLMLDTIVAIIAGAPVDRSTAVEAIRETLGAPELDAAFVGEAVLLPSESFIGDQMSLVDPEAIYQARESLRQEIALALEKEWRRIVGAPRPASFEHSPAAKGARRLSGVALGYLAASGATDAAAIAYDRFRQADNMTDRQSALGVLVNGTAAERDRALAEFFDRYAQDPLVLDKWFSVQALSIRDDTPEQVAALANHPAFNLTNPNRLRALVGAFAANQRAFHTISGRGYSFVADMIIAVDRINPQTAARLVPPLGRWRRFDQRRAAMMRAALERVLATQGLSRDSYEQVSKSLA
jgi:aminopeptidase N